MGEGFGIPSTNAPALVQAACCGPSKAQGNKQTKNRFQSGGCSRGPRLGCCRLLCQTHPASLEAGSGNQWQRRCWDRVTSDDPTALLLGRLRVLEPGHPRGRPPASTALANPSRRARYEGGDGSTLKVVAASPASGHRPGTGVWSGGTVTKGHTAACPHRVTLGERCRRGWRCQAPRLQASLSRSLDSLAGESCSQSGLGATLWLHPHSPASAGHSLPWPLLRVCGCVLPTSDSQGLSIKPAQGGHPAPGMHEGHMLRCW